MDSKSTITTVLWWSGGPHNGLERIGKTQLKQAPRDLPRNNCSPIQSWEDQIKSPAFTFRFLHRLSDLVQPAILHSDEPRKPLIALCIHMLSLGIIIAPSVLTVNTFSKARRNFKEGKMGKINAGNTWHYTDWYSPLVERIPGFSRHPQSFMNLPDKDMDNSLSQTWKPPPFRSNRLAPHHQRFLRAPKICHIHPTEPTRYQHTMYGLHWHC